LRLVPGDSIVHGLWAGTKLISLAALAIALSLQPGWPSVAVAAATVALGLGVAHIPRTAIPHLPRWFFLAVAIGALLTLSAGGPPNLHAGSVSLGLGALGEWARATSFAVVLLAAAALVSWTTALAEVGPAVRRLLGPLRWTRLPVDEWATSVALGIRCLPLLMDEVRTLAAVRRLRAARLRAARREAGSTSRRSDRRAWRRRLAEPQHLLTACLVVAVRRGNELAGAIEARGGFGRFADDDTGPTRRDAAALLVVAAAVTAIFLV
jgi:energy-coupling factor transporter transmembrane protein EcfT